MEINQGVQPVIQGDGLPLTGRSSSGQFLPGTSGNPAGPPSIMKGWQRYGDRLKFLSEKYSPDEILSFAESRYERSKLSSFDAIAIMHLARSLDPDLTKTKAGTDDLRGERKELLDRIEGQTKSQTEITGANGAPIMPLIKIVFESNNQEPPPAEIVQEETVVIENQSSQPAADVQTVQAPKIEFE